MSAGEQQTSKRTKKKGEPPVTLLLRLRRTDESALATNGELEVVARPDLPPPPPPFLTVEKPWLGNAPSISRIPPKTFYRLYRQQSTLWDREVLVVVSMVADSKTRRSVKGREDEEIAIIPTRDIKDVPNGSIGIVEKHTGPGTGYGPDAAFASLMHVVFAALDRDERVLLEIRS